jgi:hypothetical protein
MRLSEAIRLGAMLHPQAFGQLSGTVKPKWWQRFRKPVPATCAWGAALEAEGVVSRPTLPSDQSIIIRGISPSGRIYDSPHEWRVVVSPSYQCPECHGTFVGVALIAHLNDVHRWTRERIAYWVQDVELAVLGPVSEKESGVTGSLRSKRHGLAVMRGRSVHASAAHARPHRTGRRGTNQGMTAGGNNGSSGNGLVRLK